MHWRGGKHKQAPSLRICIEYVSSQKRLVGNVFLLVGLWVNSICHLQHNAICLTVTRPANAIFKKNPTTTTTTTQKEYICLLNAVSLQAEKELESLHIGAIWQPAAPFSTMLL